MRVSVLINNYNYGRYLSSAIDSALAQKYENLEVIVFDDGSTDGSQEILREYGSRIKVLYNSEKLKGLYPSYYQAHAIESAFEASTGDIIFLLDSDDLFAPEKVRKVVSVFSEDPNIQCVQHTFTVIDANGNLSNIKKRPIISGVQLPQAIYFTGRLDFFFTQTSALAFRRSALETMIPFEKDELHLLWPDVRLTRHVMFLGKITTLQERLGCYRVHGNNDSDKLNEPAFLKAFKFQHLKYVNSLCGKYGQNDLVVKSAISSLVLTFITLAFKSDMSLFEKVGFFMDFITNKLKKLSLYSFLFDEEKQRSLKN